MSETVLTSVRADEKTSAWIEYQESLNIEGAGVPLPSREDLALALPRLAIPEEDIATLLELHPVLEASSDFQWLFRRCTHVLSAAMGSLDYPPRFPNLPKSIGLLHRYFFINVFMALLPDARAYHQMHGVPDDASAALSGRVQGFGGNDHRYRSAGLHHQQLRELAVHPHPAPDLAARSAANRGRHDIAGLSEFRLGAPAFLPGHASLHHDGDCFFMTGPDSMPALRHRRLRRYVRVSSPAQLMTGDVEAVG